MSRLTINFNLIITGNNVLANLRHNIKMSSCGWNAGMETQAWSMPSSITLCSTPTHASIRFWLKSSISCTFSGRVAAPYFEINVLRSGQFGGQKSGSSYKSLTLLHFWTGSSEWCTECQGRRSSRKRDQQNLSKMIMWYCSVYNQTA